jgi:hypothetical protein
MLPDGAVRNDDETGRDRHGRLGVGLSWFFAEPAAMLVPDPVEWDIHELLD